MCTEDKHILRMKRSASRSMIENKHYKSTSCFSNSSSETAKVYSIEVKTRTSYVMLEYLRYGTTVYST